MANIHLGSHLELLGDGKYAGIWEKVPARSGVLTGEALSGILGVDNQTPITPQ
jgi:hypothetical protein